MNRMNPLRTTVSISPVRCPKRRKKVRGGRRLPGGDNGSGARLAHYLSLRRLRAARVPKIPAPTATSAAVVGSGARPPLPGRGFLPRASASWPPRATTENNITTTYIFDVARQLSLGYRYFKLLNWTPVRISFLPSASKPLCHLPGRATRDGALVRRGRCGPTGGFPRVKDQ